MVGAPTRLSLEKAQHEHSLGEGRHRQQDQYQDLRGRGPGAASIEVTIDGQPYARDIRDSRGYIILLEQQGVSASMIDDVRVYDSEGNPLPAPWLWRAGQKSGPVRDVHP